MRAYRLDFSNLKILDLAMLNKLDSCQVMLKCKCSHRYFKTAEENVSHHSMIRNMKNKSPPFCREKSLVSQLKCGTIQVLFLLIAGTGI